MKIYAFSVDLKIDADNQGYKVLEVNDFMRSGFEGYLKATGKPMISDVIIPDYQELFPEHEIVDLNYSLPKTSNKPLVVIKRGNSTFTSYSRGDLMLHAGLPFSMINSDLRFLNFCTSKAYQSQVFASRPELEKIHPVTRLISTYSEDASREYADWIDSLPEHIVLKANAECGGNGVFILESKNMRKQLADILKNTNGKKSQVWCGKKDFVGLVQDLLPPNLIEIEDELHDATMRVAVTVWRENETAPFQCKIHDAYWKPSPVPYAGEENFQSRVSYSASYSGEMPEKKGGRSLRDRLIDSFAKAVTGRNRLGLKYEPDPAVHGQPVDEEIKAWLFPQMASAMPLLVEGAVSKSVAERALEWLKSDDKAERMLGLSTCIDYDFYPAVETADGRDDIQMRYPDEIVTGLVEYIADNIATDMQPIKHLAIKLCGANPISCENYMQEVREPLLYAMYESQKDYELQSRVQSVAKVALMIDLKI